MPVLNRDCAAGPADRTTLRSANDVVVLTVVRATVLISLVCATWYYGAVHSAALYPLTMVVGIGLIVSLGSRKLWCGGGIPIPTVFVGLLLAWIGYAAIQAAPSIGPMRTWFARSSENASWLTKESAEPAIASELISPRSSSENDATSWVVVHTRLVHGTAIPENTLQAIVPYGLAMGLAVLTAIGFGTSASRRWLLIVIIANASVMSAWGIIQRAGGGEQILPGVPNDSGGEPFGSFIYKNAGAAALLPALAALVAIFIAGRRSPRSSSSYDSSNRRRLVGPRWNSRFSLGQQGETAAKFAMLFVGGILVCGLVASLSRGAWLSFTLAAVSIAPFTGISVRDRRSWWIAGGLIALMTAFALTAGVADDIRRRAGQVTGGVVMADQRWDQWADGFQTALAHFPEGSGLGTYGYASLPFQSESRGSWFREAHNQYLEILTEMGLIGIAILSVGIVWFAWISFRLICNAPNDGSRRDANHQDARQRVAWGVVGVAIFVCAAVQSSIDFVIEIPANMLLYSVLISVVAMLEAETRHRDDTEQNKQNLTRSFVCVGAVAIAIGIVGFSFAVARRGSIGDVALQNTSISRLTDQQSDGTAADAEIESSLRILDVAIVSAPMRSQLYVRRALVHLVRYRNCLIEAAADQGLHLSYPDVRIAALHVILMSQNESERPEVRRDFMPTAEARRSLALAVCDFVTAVELNPYEPNGHLRLAMLSPLIDVPTEPWLEHSVALGNNSQDILFDNGLVAFYLGDTETMLDQWSKSIHVNHDWLQPALDLAVQKVSLPTVVERLVPSNRPDRIFDLLRRHEDTADDLDQILTFVQTTDRFDVTRQNATLAQLYDLSGRLDDAIQHWRKVTMSNLLQPNFRHAWAVALQKAERHEEAIDQAVIGQRLFPNDVRFDEIARRSRQSL